MQRDQTIRRATASHRDVFAGWLIVAAFCVVPVAAILAVMGR